MGGAAEGWPPHREFVSHLMDEAGNPLDKNCVTISSIHAAKGLEWDVVFCPQWNSGFMPGGYYYAGGAPDVREVPLPNFAPPAAAAASTPEVEHDAEEQRLAHVAITRARHHLHISSVRYTAFIDGNLILENASAPVMRFIQRWGWGGWVGGGGARPGHGAPWSS